MASGWGLASRTPLPEGLIGNAILPSLLHQDPRYFYQGTGTKKSRALHAMLAPFICKGDNGKSQPNYSKWGGSLIVIPFLPLTTPVRIAVLGMYSRLLESAWACMSLAVWPRSLSWTNSQAEVSIDLEGLAAPELRLTAKVRTSISKRHLLKETPVHRMRVRQAVHYLAAVLGIALLVVLVRRTGTGTVIHQVKTIGWGFGLVLLLGGIGHLIKTWAWRLTFACEIKNVSFARTFALRLVSEAIAILGLPGQVIGEAARVSLLGSDVPIANSISSVTLDRVLYIVTSAIVTFTGMIAALLLMSFSRMWRLYALLFALGAAAMLAASALALRRRWPIFSGAARAIGQITWFKGWLDGKHSVIESAERNLFDFYYETPGPSGRAWLSTSRAMERRYWRFTFCCASWGRERVVFGARAGSAH